MSVERMLPLTSIDSMIVVFSDGAAIGNTGHATLSTVNRTLAPKSAAGT